MDEKSGAHCGKPRPLHWCSGGDCLGTMQEMDFVYNVAVSEFTVLMVYRAIIDRAIQKCNTDVTLRSVCKSQLLPRLVQGSCNACIV